MNFGPYGPEYPDVTYVRHAYPETLFDTRQPTLVVGGPDGRRVTRGQARRARCDSYVIRMTDPSSVVSPRSASADTTPMGQVVGASGLPVTAVVKLDRQNHREGTEVS
jgi:hypothetical protein